MRISDWSSDVCSSDLVSGERSCNWADRHSVRTEGIPRVRCHACRVGPSHCRIAPWNSNSGGFGWIRATVSRCTICNRPDVLPGRSTNLRKARGAFLEPNPEDLIDFAAEFDEEERLPAEFRIRIDQRSSGQSYQQWNGVFIGNTMTDNIHNH